MTLYITNGDAYNEYLLRKEKTLCALPFREAMMDPTPYYPAFSTDFIRHRAAKLRVTMRTYRKSMKDILALRDKKRHPEKIILRFGRDTFCQLNLLTLLAFLEEIGYQGELCYSPIDDESFAVLGEDIPVTLGRYREVYKAVMRDLCLPKDVGILSGSALSLYWECFSDTGMLLSLIRSHPHNTEEELMGHLMTASREYGLSDVSAQGLITRVKHEKDHFKTSADFIVRPARQEDLSSILAIYEQARIFMRKAGNPTQWERGYPSRSIVRCDLAKKNLFVIERAGAIHGVFAFFPEGDPLYDSVTGIPFAAHPYAAVHRVASAGGARGILAACMEFALANTPYIKIDTHKDNLPMQGALSALGFRPIGVFPLPEIGERILYEHLANQK